LIDKYIREHINAQGGRKEGRKEGREGGREGGRKERLTSKAKCPATPPKKKPTTAIPCSFTFHHSSVRPFMMCPSAIPKSVLAPVKCVVRTTEPL
jgi:hypothetical protein